jgi:hypothetical protein
MTASPVNRDIILKPFCLPSSKQNRAGNISGFWDRFVDWEPQSARDLFV